MELRYHSPEAAALAVVRFRTDGFQACVLDEHTPFLWSPAVVSGVRVWVADEPLMEDDEGAEEESFLRPEIHQVCVQNCLRFFFCCSCVLLMASPVVTLCNGFWSSLSFCLSFVLSMLFIIPASGNILTGFICRVVHVVLCCCVVLLGLVVIFDLLLLAWHSIFAFTFLALASTFGLLIVAELGRRLGNGFNVSILRTGEYRGFWDCLLAAVTVLVALARTMTL